MNVIDMFDSPSYEIRLFVAGDAIDVGYKLAAHSLDSSDDCATDDIDLTDGVVASAADDASGEYQTPHHRTMACERSDHLSCDSVCDWEVDHYTVALIKKHPSFHQVSCTCTD